MVTFLLYLSPFQWVAGLSALVLPNVVSEDLLAVPGLLVAVVSWATGVKLPPGEVIGALSFVDDVVAHRVTGLRVLGARW